MRIILSVRRHEQYVVRLIRKVFFGIFFFFSSRRRHTRWPRDWSSDVCSSDLLDFLELTKPDTLIPRVTSYSYDTIMDHASSVTRYAIGHNYGFHQNDSVVTHDTDRKSVV